MAREPFSMDFDDKDLQKGLDRVYSSVEEAILSGIFLASQTLLGDSLEIVPFDKGFNGGLAGTGNVVKPTLAGTDIEGMVGYNKDYAVKVHEDMSLNISQVRAAAGRRRQQKYLTKPAQENAEKYGKIISDHVAKVLNG